MKSSKIKFITEELEKEFENIDDSDFLKKSIKRALEDLKANAFCGIQIPKRLFPQKYIEKYFITNLWKYDLPKGWRLIYTITAEDEVKIVCAILEWFNHKDYEKRFRY